MVNGTLLDIVECLDPLCRVDGDILLQEAVENILDIADQWDRRSKVFADLSGIDIDVDEDGFLGLFMGGFTASAVGISAALIFSYLASLIFQPKMKE